MSIVPADRREIVACRGRALGTGVELVVDDPRAIVAASDLLHAELERIDRAASRFRSDSELLRLCRNPDEAVTVSPALFEVVETALRAAELTAGAVDPTVGGAMVRLGYDRDFEEVARGVGGMLPAARPVPGWRSVELDPVARTVRVPHGVLLDVGATAKALAADRAVAEVHRACQCGVAISLGGDVAVAGGRGEGFAVGIADVAGTSAHDEVVLLRSGGLASSGTAVRHWTLGGTSVHHILDPATGLPAHPTWRTASVCAASCVDANTASTAAMVLGPRAVAWLAGRALPARLVDHGGRVTIVGGWPPGGRARASERPEARAWT